jgi:PTS system nitrogen regulatory IIA component
MNPTSPIRSSVRLSELFPPEAIRVGLEPREKSAVIEGLVRHAVVLGHLPQQEQGHVLDALLERESMGSTALGNGVAVPHCRCRSLKRFVGVAGFLDQGIPFNAVDGEPVDRVFLTLAPLDSPEQYFEVLGRLVAIGRNKSLRLLLRGCQTAEHVSAFLKELDLPVAGRLDELARMSLSWRDRDHRDPWRELAYFSLTREDRPAGDRGGWGFPEPRWL